MTDKTRIASQPVVAFLDYGLFVYGVLLSAIGS